MYLGNITLSKQQFKPDSLSVRAAIDAGLDFALKGQLEKALAAFVNAIKLDPHHWEARRYRGVVYAKLGKYLLALRDLNVTLRYNPQCAGCFYERGFINMLSGQLDDALEDLSSCVTIDPNYAPAYSSRACILTRMGLYQKALKDIKAALALKPQNTDYLHNRAVILTALERYKEAIEDYEHVIALNPKSGGSYNNLAWILSTAKDPAFRDCRKAILLALKSLQIDKNVSWMDTLAAAYAECGEFEKAVSVEEKAYKLSVPPNENFHKRIAMYVMGKTYADVMRKKDMTPRLLDGKM
jgi:tetratricopeptide (TPR) repeat protein